MNLHPVVASLPEHEHALIFERFKEIYLESQNLELNLFGREQVDCTAFFASSRSLVIKYLDFFYSAINMKLQCDPFRLGQGGLFSYEILAIASIDDLNPSERIALERVFLVSLEGLMKNHSVDRIWETLMHRKALVNYVGNPSSTGNDLKSLFRNIVLHGSNKEADKCLVDDNKLECVKELVESVFNSLNHSEAVSSIKVDVVFAAVNSAIDEVEKILLSDQKTLDCNRAYLRNAFPRANVVPPPLLTPRPLLLAECDKLLRDAHAFFVSDYIKDICTRCINAISGKSVVSTFKDAAPFVELKIALARQAQPLDKFKYALESLSFYINRIVSDACEKDTPNSEEHHKIINVLWKNDDITMFSGGIVELVDMILKGARYTDKTFHDALLNLTCGRMAAEALNSECHASVMTDNQLDFLFREALSKRDEFNSQPNGHVNALRVTSLLQAIAQRKLYQSHLHSVLSNGDVDFKSLSSLLSVGLECGVFGMNDFKYFSPSCIRNLYDAGGSRFLNIISGHPNISEYIVNQLLMDKMTQASGIDADPQLRRRTSRNL